MELLQKIKTDNDYRDEATTHLIFLGDLVDRGPNSRGVIELMMDFPFEFADPIFVMGNHEEMMVRGLLKEPEVLPEWLKYGGYDCAESYGLSRRQLTGQSPVVQQHLLRSVIPRQHVDFLAGFLDYVLFGDILFTHAGVRPGVDLESQNPRDLRWIREPFLSFDGDHGFLVVHGHTISEEIEVNHNRIGIDTGAYQSGRLSAVCFDEGEYAFIST